MDVVRLGLDGSRVSLGGGTHGAFQLSAGTHMGIRCPPLAVRPGGPPPTPPPRCHPLGWAKRSSFPPLLCRRNSHLVDYCVAGLAPSRLRPIMANYGELHRLCRQYSFAGEDSKPVLKARSPTMDESDRKRERDAREEWSFTTGERPHLEAMHVAVSADNEVAKRHAQCRDQALRNSWGTSPCAPLRGVDVEPLRVGRSREGSGSSGTSPRGQRIVAVET